MTIIVPPQHPLAAQPCCLGCGKRDGRTKVGATYCAECNPLPPEPINRP